MNTIEQIKKDIEVKQKLVEEIEKVPEISEVENLTSQVKTTEEQLKVLQSELTKKLETVQSKLSPEVYEYLYGNTPTVKDSTSKTNGNSKYLQLTKDFYTGKNFSLSVEKIYGSRDIATLKKAAKGIEWTARNNGLVTVQKPSSCIRGKFYAPVIELTDKGKEILEV